MIFPKVPRTKIINKLKIRVDSLCYDLGQVRSLYNGRFCRRKEKKPNSILNFKVSLGTLKESSKKYPVTLRIFKDLLCL